jgi:hypothetical protein
VTSATRLVAIVLFFVWELVGGCGGDAIRGAPSSAAGGDSSPNGAVGARTGAGGTGDASGVIAAPAGASGDGERAGAGSRDDLTQTAGRAGVTQAGSGVPRAGSDASAGGSASQVRDLSAGTQLPAAVRELPVQPWASAHPEQSRAAVAPADL